MQIEGESEMTEEVAKIEEEETKKNEADSDEMEEVEAIADEPKENIVVKKEETKVEMKDEKMDSTPPVVEDKKETKKMYNIIDHYRCTSTLDIGKCLIMSGLPSSLYEDDADIFNDCIVGMLVEDFTVKKDSIESITRLNKGEDEENGCRVLVSFKSRVHKHRVMAVKNRSNVGYTLEHVEVAPTEVVEILKEKEKEQKDEEVLEDERTKKEDEKKKDEDKFRDEHSILPFIIEWEGAPEFQWKIPDGGNACKLIIDNADILDLHEPFLYRCSLRAQQVLTKMPGRIIEDQPTALHYGTITLVYLNDGEAIQHAMANLIYFRSNGERRVKVYLPQTKTAVKRKQTFEQRLGRKIEYPPDMYKILVKSDLSLDESRYGIEEARGTFPGRDIESVERITDANQKVGFVVTFKTAQEMVYAHSRARHIKIGDVKCRVYALGVEALDGDKGADEIYLTKWEKYAIKREEVAKRRKEVQEKIEKGEIVPKRARTFPKKPLPSPSKQSTSLANRPVLVRRRGGLNTNSSNRSIPMIKSKAPSFKPIGNIRGRRGGMNGPSSSSSSRDDRRSSPWSKPPSSIESSLSSRRNPSSVMNTSAFGSPTHDRIRMDEMVREQRRQMEIQEQLLRQQDMINVMQDRLRERESMPALSASAFRQPDYDSRGSSMYGGPQFASPSAVAYNKADIYEPSPPFEPLSSFSTPSHLSNPARPFDSASSSSASYNSSSAYGKPSSSSYGSSSSYRDRRY